MENPYPTTEIPCFTISALMDMVPHGETSRSFFCGQLIAKCGSEMDTFRFPCRIDAIIISLCTEGECVVVSNLREYTLTKGSMFICGPKNILQVSSSNNFRSDLLVVAPGLLGQTRINIKSMMPLLIEFGDRPCLPLPKIEMQALRNLIAQIETEIRVPIVTVFTAEVVNGLVSASIAKIGDILLRHMEQNSAPTNLKYNRTEEYFKQFMQLLGEHYKEERTVNFYARQMCITPKYLTTLIKRISDKSVSQWIDEYVVLEAKMLLKHSNMSIQEIAYHLNFPNQSFFGSYFRRITGMSPSEYKAL